MRLPFQTKNLWPQAIPKGGKVYVGMSGGVDSSVAAYLLKQQPHLEVEAVYMRNWDTRDEDHSECPSERDWRDVQKVCRQLDIKCHQISLVKEYWNTVFSIALDEYSRGRTPNPDVLCNREIKFGVLLNEIQRRLHTGNSTMWFATGHYAQTRQLMDGSVGLFRGTDRRKDQSYFLSAVSHQHLQQTVFPLGTLDKQQDVRRIAREQAQLVTAEKEESMGICFVGQKRRFDQFLSEYLPQRPGDIVDSKGTKIGQHSGLFTKTIGQLALIPGMQDKWYIYDKDIGANRMYAAPNRANPLLYTESIRAAGPVHWIGGTSPTKMDLSAQIRYMQEPQLCTVTLNADDERCLRVDFKDPQFGVAPGQYLVLYDGEQCLGCAAIEEK